MFFVITEKDNFRLWAPWHRVQRKSASTRGSNREKVKFMTRFINYRFDQVLLTLLNEDGYDGRNNKHSKEA
jgi:hypothetical protein